MRTLSTTDHARIRRELALSAWERLHGVADSATAAQPPVTAHAQAATIVNIEPVFTMNASTRHRARGERRTGKTGDSGGTAGRAHIAVWRNVEGGR